ncbi:hypothetical protein QR685DRAFT_553649 [Neurospora intermedia]|uniref:Uncharacterized protein n=1 Tax=Neurospora intermedia TaxID=5142 RepID=A0ABR3DDH2_NEUIN
MEEQKHRLDSYFTARRQQPTNVVEDDDVLKHPCNAKVCARYTVKPAQVDRYPATSIILE